MTKLIELIEGGREGTNEFDAPVLCRAISVLEERCRECGGMRVEGVWRLHRSEAVELEEALGSRPAGGWRALCSLAVGTGVIRAEEEAFVPGSVRCQEWESDADMVRVRLVEAFTRWLIPPATAAGLFLAMNIHPLWGLRLARRLHVDAPMLDGPLEGWRDEALLPDEDLAQLRKGVFAALSVVMAGLRKLRPDRRYPTEALVAFISEAINYGAEQIDESGLGLQVIIDGGLEAPKAASRSAEFAAREFFDGVLLPAGVMRRYDDDTFGVDSAVLDNVQVGHLGRDAQRTWLRCFLGDRSSGLVA